MEITIIQTMVILLVLVMHGKTGYVFPTKNLMEQTKDGRSIHKLMTQEKQTFGMLLVL